MSSDKLISLIAKLRAHEQSARSIGNKAEAEAFAGKVAQLLAEHKLTMTEVEYQSQARTNPFGCSDSKKNGGGSVPQSSLRLAEAIARHTFTKMFYYPGRNQVTFVGRESDRQAAVELFMTLEKASWRLARKDWKAAYPLNVFHRGPYAIQWAKSYLEGFSVGVALRMANQAQAAKAANSDTTGIILRESAALQAYVETLRTKDKGHGRKNVGTNTDAYYQGKAAGENTNINRTNNLRLGSGK